MTTTVNNTFIQGLYTNVLQETGDQAGINYWQAQADAGVSAADITSAFINSAQGNQVESIIRLYETFFNRAPDSAGLASWTNLLYSGSPLTNIASAFGQSPEFATTYAGTDTTQYVEAIYINLFNRASDLEGKTYWVNAIESGVMSRTDVALAFATSPEALLSTAAPTRFADSYLVLRAGGNLEPSSAEVEALAQITLDEALIEQITSFDPAQDAITAAANAAAAAALVAAALAAANAAADADAAAAAAAAAAAVAAAEAAALLVPITFNLTTGVDNFTGNNGDDNFLGSYDGGLATDTFGFGGNDVLNGGAGSDTLTISHPIDVVITPPDALWTSVSNIENIIINTAGNGAQTIITDAFFQAAFGTGGVNLTTTTLGSGAINISMVGFTGATAITSTSVAGEQTIVTGTGVATVNATSAAGALVIRGVGLTTVTALTTGAGAQTIGDAIGGGANLVSVNADTAAGAQTITSTSNSAVTITSVSVTGSTNTIAATGSGIHTIIGGDGNYTITGGSGVDTITGGTGIDTFNFGANGSVIGTSLDVITDFQTIDRISFGATTALVAADATALVAGVNVNNTAGGLITFAAGDNTLQLKITAVQADVELDVAGTVAMFVDGGNTYFYYAGTTTGNVDDQLIQLTGVTTLTAITGGGTNAIA